MGLHSHRAGPWLSGFILLLCQSDEIAVALQVSIQKSLRGIMSKMFSSHRGVKSHPYLFMRHWGSALSRMLACFKGWIRLHFQRPFFNNASAFCIELLFHNVIYLLMLCKDCRCTKGLDTESKTEMAVKPVLLHSTERMECPLLAQYEIYFQFWR